MVVKRGSLGKPVIQAADLDKDCNSFTVCVAVGMFALGVWGITLSSFSSSSETGILLANVLSHACVCVCVKEILLYEIVFVMGRRDCNSCCIMLLVFM